MLPRRRDGAAQGYFSPRGGDEPSRPWVTIPPGYVCRRESVIGGRFAPWQWAQTKSVALAKRPQGFRDFPLRHIARESLLPAEILSPGCEVGRGVGQGYFAWYAGGCGFESHLADVSQ